MARCQLSRAAAVGPLRLWGDPAVWERVQLRKHEICASETMSVCSARSSFGSDMTKQRKRRHESGTPQREEGEPALTNAVSELKSFLETKTGEAVE